MDRSKFFINILFITFIVNLVLIIKNNNLTIRKIKNNKRNLQKIKPSIPNNKYNISLLFLNIEGDSPNIC
ncbi:hypothetical protein CFE53_01820 [Methanofervidicoccus sp. A16]|nr:hypothetical protein CFE53_01820 [Methanofervidicoccus sp. A16]